MSIERWLLASVDDVRVICVPQAEKLVAAGAKDGLHSSASSKNRESFEAEVSSELSSIITNPHDGRSYSAQAAQSHFLMPTVNEPLPRSPPLS